MILEIKQEPHSRSTTFGHLPIKATFKLPGVGSNILMKCEKGFVVNLTAGRLESDIVDNDEVIPAATAELVVKF